MERQTRVNKYKELREEMKEEVTIHPQKEDIQDEDDDFLSFLPKKDKKVIEDTLLEPLSYETLNHDNDEVKHALNEAKVNVGKEQYDTRLDILKKIKKEDAEQTQQQNVHLDKKMSLLEKLAAMSPEEDAKELEAYEQETTAQELLKQQKKEKKKVVKEEIKKEPVEQKKTKKEKKQKIKEETPKTKESRLVTILNYAIIIFMIIFIVLVIFIGKQLLF